MPDINQEFAKIIAQNYTAEEQPMWEASSEILFNNHRFDIGKVIDIMTIAYIPMVGRIDILIVPDDFDYGEDYGTTS
ncbi:MAG: hypothetical protein CMQ83_01785 [Gammaproteobacteria bacterium]|nr:hypothetical protein [Gammaproteobacteria bacterium]